MTRFLLGLLVAAFAVEIVLLARSEVTVEPMLVEVPVLVRDPVLIEPEPEPVSVPAPPPKARRAKPERRVLENDCKDNPDPLCGITRRREP